MSANVVTDYLRKQNLATEELKRETKDDTTETMELIQPGTSCQVTEIT